MSGLKPVNLTTEKPPSLISDSDLWEVDVLLLKGPTHRAPGSGSLPPARSSLFHLPGSVRLPDAEGQTGKGVLRAMEGAQIWEAKDPGSPLTYDGTRADTFHHPSFGFLNHNTRSIYSTAAIFLDAGYHSLRIFHLTFPNV